MALGSLAYVTSYTKENSRPWPYTPSPAPSAPAEFPILERYGTFFAHLCAAEALADRAGKVIASIYVDHSAKRDITAQERGEAAEWVASVKVVVTDTGLEVTQGVFETTGARATGRKVGLDQFWRDIRTHSLHDPVSYKKFEQGRYILAGEVPEPTWYT